MQQTRTTKEFIVFVLVAVTVSALESQERAPNGQIYRELKPFVGLDGVRFELQGIGGVIFNVPPGKGDPQTETTGMNRAQPMNSIAQFAQMLPRLSVRPAFLFCPIEPMDQTRSRDWS